VTRNEPEEGEESVLEVVLRRFVAVGAVVLLVAYLAQQFGGDAVVWLVWMRALWFLFPVVALLLMAIGALLRSGPTILVLLPVVVLAVPDLLPPGTPPPMPEGQAIRVVSANALFRTSPDVLVEEVLTAEPDILLVQEHTPALHALVEGRFAHHRNQPQANGPFGLGLYSTFPITGFELLELGGVPWMRATLDVDGVDLQVWNVHTMPPLDADKHVRWLGQLATLTAAAERVEGPLVVAGDFNLTPQMAGYQRLVAAGLVDAHADCERWGATTFPASGRTGGLPSFLKLDYVFLAGVRCSSIREGVGAGSDHRPLFAELVLPR
jgi:endonuclease/exonuclease/phosphatase (EEP) superfamily protein YafD